MEKALLRSAEKVRPMEPGLRSQPVTVVGSGTGFTMEELQNFAHWSTWFQESEKELQDEECRRLKKWSLKKSK